VISTELFSVFLAHNSQLAQKQAFFTKKQPFSRQKERYLPFEKGGNERKTREFL
jgi:hypothetical protein